MTKLPWRDTILSGFLLVRRRPVAAGCWALTLMTGGMVVAGLQVWALTGVREGASLATMATKVGLIGMALNVVIVTVVGAGILRAVVRPDDRHAAWPRFGGDEVRLLGFAPLFALLVFLAAAVFASVLIVRPSGGNWMASNFDIGMRIATGVLLALGARLALAAPMTIAERRLRFGGALSLSPGLHGRLMVIFIGGLILAAGIEAGGSYARGMLSVAMGSDQAPLMRSPSIAAAMRSAFGPEAMLLRVLGASVQALALAVQLAPIGDAYRRLASDPIADQAAVFD